jgi:hypothetical protein
VPTDHDLVCFASDPALNLDRFDQIHTFIDWIKLFRLINMSEIAPAILQLLELNPHDHSALPPIA